MEGRRLLVTGGSTGIGRAVAEALASRGARIVIAARRRGLIDRALGSLPGEGHSGIGLDVADPSGWETTLPELSADGGLDGLVTAAGVLGPVGTIGSYDPGDFWNGVQVNLFGTFLALHHCLPLLAASRGSAVTFSGGGGTRPLPRYDAYAASKAAVVRLTENIAAVASERGVRVNCAAPGFVATEIHRGTLAAGPEAAGEAYHEATRRGLEEGGFPATEAAELVAFLLSEEASSINGKLISAQWDPWREDGFRERLEAEPDFGALRRIDGQHFDRSP
jgi:NAD(P)-dependent dehydrogenase (short-subunit alcohol dehydrogenase family)